MNNFYDSFLCEKQCDEIKDWYDYEMYFDTLMAEEIKMLEECDDYM